MSRKQKVLTFIIVLLVIIAGIVAAYFLFVKEDIKSNTTVQAAVTDLSTLDPAASELLSLEQNKKNGTTNSGRLAVNDSGSISSNLGSGRSSANIASNSGDSGSSNQVNFRDYEQYKDKKEVYFGDIVIGDGAVAQKDSQLAVIYKGYLTNGQMFDQSRSGSNGKLQPLLFTLGGGQLIPGFEQGVAGMKTGGSRRIIIPPSLGYGEKAQNGIPANSVLIFDVELIAAQ